MTTQPTPAPWLLHDKQSNGAYQITGEKEGSLRIATITNSPNDQANARLIAAAPELLGALELAELELCLYILHNPDDNSKGLRALKIIRAALEKAGKG